MDETRMSKRGRGLVVGLAGILAWGFLGFSVLAEARAEVSYQIIDLGGLEGARSSAAVGINDSGQIIGGSFVNDEWEFRPILWDDGTVTAYAAAEGVFDYGVTSINNSGLAVGKGGTISPEGNVVMTALLYPSIGEVVMLNGAGATDINNNGQVVLHTYGSGTSIWQEGVAVISIPIYGYSVNDDELVAGRDSEGYACVYDLNTQTTLSLGAQAPTNESFTSDINNQGQVVFRGINLIGNTAIFYYDSEQGIVKITAEEMPDSVSNVAINDEGQVIGTFDGNGFLWQDGKLAYLDELIDPASGWSSLCARDINHSGWIVGSGVVDGEWRSFLMTPVPEPGTILMFVLGGLAAMRKRR